MKMDPSAIEFLNTHIGNVLQRNKTVVHQVITDIQKDIESVRNQHQDEI